MRNLSNAVAGAAGFVILLGALAATPTTTFGQSRATTDAGAAKSSSSPLRAGSVGAPIGPAAGDRMTLSRATGPELGECQNLQVEAGNQVAARMYAEGFQIYHWDGMSWTFVAPDAVLFADAGGNGEVGTHYGGPTWESMSGSKVIGRVKDRCTPDPDAIPWLLLDAVYSEGPGIFDGVTFIQRVNTVGGLAPADPGEFPGQVARVPYTAEYYFFRARE